MAEEVTDLRGHPIKPGDFAVYVGGSYPPAVVVVAETRKKVRIRYRDGLSYGPPNWNGKEQTYPDWMDADKLVVVTELPIVPFRLNTDE